MTSTGTTPTTRTGRLGASSANRSDPVLLLPRRRPGYLGPIHITQLLLAEIVVVAVLVAVSRGVIVIAGAVLAGVALLVLTLTRRGGRWWLEQRLMTWQYRRRRRAQVPALAGDDPRLHALRRFAPGLTVENVRLADGTQVGVAHDDTGWYAVAAVAPRSIARNDPIAISLESMTFALAEAEQPGAVLQIVTQTVPALIGDIPATSPVGSSYQQLLGRFGSTELPADRTTWVAVRLDARMLAEAVAGDRIDLAIAPAVVAALARRIAKVQRRAGVTLRLLNADSLVGTLIQACDLGQAQPAGDLPREDWSAWRSPTLSHKSYWVRDWPAVSGASGMLDRLSTTPSAQTTVALIIAPDLVGRTADLRALVRVAAPVGELKIACRTLTRRANEAKAELFPLDGEQAPAVYASAPTGGGAR